MIRTTILLIALLVMVSGFVVSCTDDDPATPATRATGTIQGLAYDVAAEVPLTGATVTITSTPFMNDTTGTGEIIIETTTDGSGRFLRSDIPNGYVVIRVTHAGYRTPDTQDWALSPGGGSDFRFDLAPGEDPIPEFDGDEQSARPPNWNDEGK